MLNINVSALMLTEDGQIVLSDADLDAVENITTEASAGGNGINAGNCSGTTNAGCANSNTCHNSMNAGCTNWSRCNGSTQNSRCDNFEAPDTVVE
jgi:hypothetical protein